MRETDETIGVKCVVFCFVTVALLSSAHVGFDVANQGISYAMTSSHPSASQDMQEVESAHWRGSLVVSVLVAALLMPRLMKLLRKIVLPQANANEVNTAIRVAHAMFSLASTMLGYVLQKETPAVSLGQLIVATMLGEALTQGSLHLLVQKAAPMLQTDYLHTQGMFGHMLLPPAPAPAPVTQQNPYLRVLGYEGA